MSNGFHYYVWRISQSRQLQYLKGKVDFCDVIHNIGDVEVVLLQPATRGRLGYFALTAIIGF